ncbi:baeRF3 domain-containing protein [Rubinisphaera margarita]|uniref:baeRF3 domain-containing protein n=1 Tax=Rubinisphaera margarita TaxID=2909586 RepID=UPI001EE7CB56|nr:hypothetical protein [Rubinisphaera margarita]MCG6155320.1 hypothetical protein [Rubinisphaera margarita]
MLKTPKMNDVRELSAEGGEPCVSIYLPTHEKGPETREDPIRLRNCINEASKQLADWGMPGGEIRLLFQPFEDLHRSDGPAEAQEFWQHQGAGLAIFVSPNQEHQIFSLPDEVQEQTIIAPRFHVLPLLGALQHDRQFCLLDVSQNQVRLFEGSRTGLTAVELDDLPGSLIEVINGHQQKGFALHSFGGQPGAKDQAVPHGHYEHDRHAEYKEFLKAVAKPLNEYLYNSHKPLVFAGVDELFSYFRKECDYPHLVSEPISGNHDNMNPAELHKLAWPMVEKQIGEDEQLLLDRWGEARTSPAGKESIAEILIAAQDGRVETLLLQEGHPIWGTFDEEQRSISNADENAADNYDLCNVAALKTLRADGEVRLINGDQSFSEDGVAAIFRY